MGRMVYWESKHIIDRKCTGSNKVTPNERKKTRFVKFDVACPPRASSPIHRAGYNATGILVSARSATALVTATVTAMVTAMVTRYSRTTRESVLFYLQMASHGREDCTL